MREMTHYIVKLMEHIVKLPANGIFFDWTYPEGKNVCSRFSSETIESIINGQYVVKDTDQDESGGAEHKTLSISEIADDAALLRDASRSKPTKLSLGILGFGNEYGNLYDIVATPGISLTSLIFHLHFVDDNRRCFKDDE